MPDSKIRFTCPRCGKRLKARAEAGGRKGKCNSCGQALIVPSIQRAAEDKVCPVVEPSEERLPFDFDAPSPSEPNETAPSTESARKGRRNPRHATNPLNTLGIFVLVVWAVISLATALLVDEKGLTMIVFIGVGLAGALFCGWVANTQCPMCKSIWAKQYLGSNLVDRSEGYDTVTRYQRDTQGRVISSWEEQVHVVRQTHLDHYKCSACGYAWTGLSQRQYEG
jgi:hypothetical protein